MLILYNVNTSEGNVFGFCTFLNAGVFDIYNCERRIAPFSIAGRIAQCILAKKWTKQSQDILFRFHATHRVIFSQLETGESFPPPARVPLGANNILFQFDEALRKLTHFYHALCAFSKENPPEKWNFDNRSKRKTCIISLCAQWQTFLFIFGVVGQTTLDVKIGDTFSSDERNYSDDRNNSKDDDDSDPEWLSQQVETQIARRWRRWYTHQLWTIRSWKKITFQSFHRQTRMHCSNFAASISLKTAAKGQGQLRSCAVPFLLVQNLFVVYHCSL